MDGISEGLVIQSTGDMHTRINQASGEMGGERHRVGNGWHERDRGDDK